jgi:hypothetical protein
MRRLRATAMALLAAVAVLPAHAVAASDATPGLSASVDRTQISTQLGRRFELDSTITNAGPGTAHGLVAHLSVLSLREDPYVDPEDWAPQRVVFLDPIPPGESRTLRWSMTAVNAGTFGVYVTVLPQSPRDGPAPNTPTVELRVTQRRTLNSGGILPLALAVPALLGALTIAVRLRRRE